MTNLNLLYTDVDPELKPSWNRDIATSTGARAIKNSLLGIIMTKKGTRPFDPEFGCDLGDQLFENLTPLVADTVERSIVAAIRAYEPRVLRLAVTVTPLYDANELNVEVAFSILDNPDVLEQLKIRLSNI